MVNYTKPLRFHWIVSHGQTQPGRSGHARLQPRREGLIYFLMQYYLFLTSHTNWGDRTEHWKTQNSYVTSLQRLITTNCHTVYHWIEFDELYMLVTLLLGLLLLERINWLQVLRNHMGGSLPMAVTPTLTSTFPKLHGYQHVGLIKFYPVVHSCGDQTQQ